MLYEPFRIAWDVRESRSLICHYSLKISMDGCCDIKKSNWMLMRSNLKRKNIPMKLFQNMQKIMQGYNKNYSPDMCTTLESFNK